MAIIASTASYPVSVSCRSSQETSARRVEGRSISFCQEAASRSASSDAYTRFNLCYRHEHIECITERVPLKHRPNTLHLIAAAYPHGLLADTFRRPCARRSLTGPRLPFIVKYSTLQRHYTRLQQPAMESPTERMPIACVHCAKAKAKCDKKVSTSEREVSGGDKWSSAHVVSSLLLSA